MTETKHYRCVTLSGVPLELALEWPIRTATSGGDFHVIHGDVRPADASGLHALIAVQIVVTVVDTLASLQESDAAPAVINVVRKEIDQHQLEFLKSPKRIPVWLSSRYLKSVRQKELRFHEATDDQVASFLRRKVYWFGHDVAVAVADANDALYLGATPQRLRQAASRLAAEGWITLHGDSAQPTARLAELAAEFEAERNAALERLQMKHAFERA